jgi:tetratricopeptide (TPR) repeat protein
LRYSGLRDDAKVTPGSLVYLPPVRNETSDRAFDGITELMQAGLSQSVQINVLDQSRVEDTLQRMTKTSDTVIDVPIAREIAMRNRALRVVFVTVTGSGDNYRLDVDLQQPDNTPSRYRAHWKKSFTWQSSPESGKKGAIPQELLTAVRDASNWVRHRVGESGNDIAQLDAPPEDVTTGSWTALEYFVRADELNRAHRTEDALIALQSALKADPEFALAYGRLGDLEVSLGRTAEGFTAYRRALETSLDRRLTRREMDRIRGIYASDSWDYGTAEEAFRDYTVFYPNDFRGWFYRALPLMRLGRYEEAMATLERAEQVMPGNLYVPYDAGLCALERGNAAAARTWVMALRDRGQQERSRQLAGIAALLNGDLKGARDEFGAMRTSSIAGLRLQGHALLARLWAEEGDTKLALDAVRAGEEEAKAQGAIAEQARFFIDEASLLCDKAQWKLCFDRVHQGVELDASPELLLEASEVLGEALEGAPRADLPQLRAALDHVARATPNPANNHAYDLVRLRLRAEKLAAVGDISNAIAEARHAAVLDQQYRRREQLVRLLLSKASRTSVATQRSALREEARQALALSALHPTAVWLQSQLYRPGTWRNDVRLYKREFGSDAGDTELAKVLPLFEVLQSASSPQMP